MPPSGSPITDLAHGGGADAAGDAAHALSGGAIDPFVFRFAIFVLAIFVGYYVVWSVTPALHTPLMAVTNAISSVIVVGALLAVGISASGLATGFGFVALTLASVNIFGGFLVTQRMLAMYRKKESVTARRMTLFKHILVAAFALAAGGGRNVRPAADARRKARPLAATVEAFDAAMRDKDYETVVKTIPPRIMAHIAKSGRRRRRCAEGGDRSPR